MVCNMIIDALGGTYTYSPVVSSEENERIVLDSSLLYVLEYLAYCPVHFIESITKLSSYARVSEHLASKLRSMHVLEGQIQEEWSLLIWRK